MKRPHPIGAARRLDEATPLRVTLVLVVLVLASVGLALAATATTASLNSYLVSRLDNQLTDFLNQVENGRFHDYGIDPGQRQPGAPFTFGDGRENTNQPPLPSPIYVLHFNAAGVANGSVDASLRNQSPPDLPTLSLSRAQSLGAHPFTVKSRDGHSSWRVETAVLPGGSGTVAVAISLTDTSHTIHHVILLETAIGLVAVLLMGLAGFALIRRSLRPLNAVENTAVAIAGGDLSQRVPQLPVRTEVGRLSFALNSMLTQIETAFVHERASEQQARESEQRMRRFVGDASHELRTPLTSIRGFAELYRMGAAADPDELPRLMRRIEDEAARMGLLVDDLLLLARLDQQRPLASEPVDLLAIVSSAAHAAQAMAPDRQVTVDAAGAVPAVVRGDESRLRQVVTNLLSNAVAHTPTGTPIEIRLSTDDVTDEATIEVADRGSGIPEGTADRIFERFYRADGSRSREGGGSGLGLSIVAGLVAAHGGSVTFRNRDGGGAVFAVRLPLLTAHTTSHLDTRS